MANPAYSTDLATQTDCSSVTGFSEASGFTSTDGTGVADTDLAIYGSVCVTESQRKSGAGSLFYTGTARTLPTDGAFFIWFKFFAPNALLTKANGGLQALIGDNNANFRRFFISGSDTYAYGGWVNYAVDPRVTPSQTTGNPGGTTFAGVGIGCDLSVGIAKGNSYNIDHIRWGRGALEITGGDTDPTNNPANFTGASIANDNPTTGRWGILQDVGGSYLFKGLLSLGTTAALVDFRDQNKVLTIDNTEFVSSNFNRIEVNNASSNVALTNVSISSLSTVSRGNWECVDNATVALSGCTFADMGTFIFASNTTVNNETTFRRCNSVSPKGATMTNCNFNSSNDTTGAMTLDADTEISGVSDCNFDNNNIAIKITSAGTYTFDNLNFTNIGTATVDFTGTGTCTINPTNGGNVAQANVTASGGGTIVVNAPSLSFTVNNLKPDSEVRIFRQSDGVEVGTGTESAAVSDTVNSTAGDPRFQHTISHTQGGTAVNIVVFSEGWSDIYQPFTLPSISGQTFLATQTVDRNFFNP